MARTARVKSTAEDKVYYHLISRTNNREFLFRKNAPKDKLMELARRAAEFCGVKIVAATIMSNHFHILCMVDRTGGPVSMEEVLRRIGVLKGEKTFRKLESEWNSLAAAGLNTTLEKQVNRWRARMNDISEYMKTMKELFAIWYKREYGYTGSLWDGAFRSTMVEGGRYLEFCRRYIMMNPIRAGIVAKLSDYRWVWTADESIAFAGCLPIERCMAKVAQIGSGKVFGSEGFVMKWIGRLGDKWRAKYTAAHRVGEIGYSTHGWRLAREGEAA